MEIACDRNIHETSSIHIPQTYTQSQLVLGVQTLLVLSEYYVHSDHSIALLGEGGRQVFGVPLSDLAEQDGTNIPKVVSISIRYLERGKQVSNSIYSSFRN
jgi:hypothetical protein